MVWNSCYAIMRVHMLQIPAVRVALVVRTLSRHAKYEDDMLQSPCCFLSPFLY
jgi:hypothetical protein